MTTKTVKFYRYGWTCSKCDHADNAESDSKCTKCNKSYEEEQDTYWENDEGVEFPAIWAICHDCQGEGKSCAYLGAFTAEDFDYEGPEFREDYMSGRYDKPCKPCEGSGKVKEINEGVISANSPLGTLLKQYHEKLKGDAEYAAECEAERRMGA